MKSDGLTPIRQQYLKVKQQYPGAIVLFRLGDFYETFDEDARIASRELDIVLTSREMGKGNKVPLAGIPYHAIDNYLARLVNRGYKVAICEQVTRPGETRGLVEREVVRVVTPGTVIEPNLLDSKTNNYLVALVPGEEETGLAYVDITTGEFAVTQVPVARAQTELIRLKPSEVIAGSGADLSRFDVKAAVTPLEDYWLGPEAATRTLLEHFRVATLEGYGCAHLPLAVRAAGAVIHYLQETQKAAASQLNRLSTYSTESYMALDMQTQRNLELFQSQSTGSVAGSLLSILDLTRTPMGGRLLKKWLGQPLLDIKELTRRQEAVTWFNRSGVTRARIVALLGQVADLERVINRVRSGAALPRELVTLRRSLEAIPELKASLDGGEVAWLQQGLRLHEDVVALLKESVADDPPVNPDDGGVIKAGFSAELDDLRLKSQDSRQYLAGMEQRERERSGIKSLKLGYNRVFGYYIEISTANLSQVPGDYIRKQTLTNGERFYTAELKEYESLALNVQERIAELEAGLFKRVCRQVAGAGESVLETAQALAQADVFACLAEVAVRYSYVCPVLNEGNAIMIKEGRHPVVERNLEGGSFVTNDTFLSNDNTQIAIITGPNMSGKSTYLRQVALIVLLAQVGSFVPATSAAIGLVDRIFTRIGARDDLAAGQSTFMIEMVETANILNNATPRSLIILDEIGRGTSTYDGMSIAQAVAEHIHNSPQLGARTVFATHYHELVALAGYLPRVKNFNVAVAEENGKVIFLHRVVPGGVDKSYGVHVGELAGLPKAVVKRAWEVLSELESGSRQPEAGKRQPVKETTSQLSLFGQRSPVEEELLKLDPDTMSPLEALNKLYELKKKNKS